MNDDARGIYITNSQIKFKPSLLKSNPCDYSDTYILVKGAIRITGSGADVAAQNADARNKQVTFKSCAPFTDSISEINDTQVDNAKGLDVVMLMYSLIEHSNNQAKTSESVWQYHKDDNNSRF